MVRLTDRPDMTLDVYRGRKTTTQQRFGPAKLTRGRADSGAELVSDRVDLFPCVSRRFAPYSI